MLVKKIRRLRRHSFSESIAFTSSEYVLNGSRNTQFAAGAIFIDLNGKTMIFSKETHISNAETQKNSPAAHYCSVIYASKETKIIENSENVIYASRNIC